MHIRRSSFLLVVLALITVVTTLPTWLFADNRVPVKFGFIGALSGFAASYGTAVLDGARLAQEELKIQGIPIELVVEDDQSNAKSAAAAYTKLTKIDKVSAIIGGSWWIDSIVKNAERDGVPIISCETVYNSQSVLGKNTFILQGDLRRWITSYEKLIAEKAWRTAAVAHFTSGFGITLAQQMKETFSTGERHLLGAIPYGDPDMTAAAQIALKIKSLHPEVLYIDAQPLGLAALLKKLSEVGASKNITILTNSIMLDVLNENLADVSPFKEIYFTHRPSYDSAFESAFHRRYSRPPALNSDLGFYALQIFAKAHQQRDVVSAIKMGLEVKNILFSFDEKNVFNGMAPSIMTVREGIPVKMY